MTNLKINELLTTLKKEVNLEIPKRYKIELSYIMYENVLVIDINDSKTMPKGDFKTFTIDVKENDRLDVKYIDFIKQSILLDNYKEYYQASEIENFLIDVFNSNDSEFTISHGYIYGDIDDEGFIPLSCITRIDYDEENETIVLYDEDIDIHSHIINLRDDSCRTITMDSHEEYNRENVEDIVDFLVSASPFSAKFKVVNETLMYMGSYDYDFGIIARLDEIKEITFAFDNIGIHFFDRELSLYITKHGIEC